MKRRIEIVLSSFGISVLWVFYAFAIRPVVLMVELACVLFGFLSDVVTFPIDYIKSQRKEREEPQ